MEGKKEGYEARNEKRRVKKGAKSHGAKRKTASSSEEIISDKC